MHNIFESEYCCRRCTTYVITYSFWIFKKKKCITHLLFRLLVFIFFTYNMFKIGMLHVILVFWANISRNRILKRPTINKKNVRKKRNILHLLSVCGLATFEIVLFLWGSFLTVAWFIFLFYADTRKRKTSTTISNATPDCRQNL